MGSNFDIVGFERSLNGDVPLPGHVEAHWRIGRLHMAWYDHLQCEVPKLFYKLYIGMYNYHNHYGTICIAYS